MGGSSRSRMAEANIVTDAVAGIAAKASPWNRLRRQAARFDPFDVATIALLAAIAAVALWTFRDYAISNDEAVQHHYGELILNYYASGFKDQSVFHFENLYLYGGLFDIIAVSLSHLIPIDPYDLRHILCALIGVAGIGATAATARSVAGPRAGLIAAIALGVCGAWYGTMFNHTKDIPFAAAMIGATLFLIRIDATSPLASPSRYRSFRRAGGRCARHARPRPDPGRLCRLRDHRVPAGGGRWPRPNPDALAPCGGVSAARAARLRARLSHHDLRVAVGGAGAAQPDPRLCRLLRISLWHPHLLRRPDLRHGRRAPAVYPGLHADPPAAAHAVRRHRRNAVRAAAASQPVPRRCNAGTSPFSRSR